MFGKSQPNAFKNLRNASQSTRWTLKNALHTFKSVPVYAEKLQNIRNLIQSEGGRYGLDAHDVRTVVKQFDLGPDEIRGFSSRIFYNLRSDINSQENIYDANRNERFLTEMMISNSSSFKVFKQIFKNENLVFAYPPTPHNPAKSQEYT